MKVADIWKTSETFTMEMKVLRATVKFHINPQNTGWLFLVYIQSYVISPYTPSVCLRSLNSLCIGVVIFRTLGEILTPTEVKSNLSSGINGCRIPATRFVYIRLHQIHVVFMFHFTWDLVLPMWRLALVESWAACFVPRDSLGWKAERKRE